MKISTSNAIQMRLDISSLVSHCCWEIIMPFFFIKWLYTLMYILRWLMHYLYWHCEKYHASRAEQVYACQSHYRYASVDLDISHYEHLMLWKSPQVDVDLLARASSHSFSDCRRCVFQYGVLLIHLKISFSKHRGSRFAETVYCYFVNLSVV